MHCLPKLVCKDAATSAVDSIWGTGPPGDQGSEIRKPPDDRPGSCPGTAGGLPRGLPRCGSLSNATFGQALQFIVRGLQYVPQSVGLVRAAEGLGGVMPDRCCVDWELACSDTKALSIS